MNTWLKILGLSLGFLTLLLGVNELILTKAGHLKSITSDADLWAIERSKISELNDEAIVLIGASRMQVDIDLQVLKRNFPNREIIQLALSGRGSSFPVFEDLVTNTNFKGIIVISENQESLVNLESKQRNVINNYRAFTLDSRLNKEISIWFEKRFLFLNPNSNTERIYGNLIVERNLPEPMFTQTYETREQTSFFDITDSEWIYRNKIKGLKKKVSRKPVNFNAWKTNLAHWKLLLEKFKQKGGRPVFVHMPFSKERWEIEEAWMPKNEYWDRGIKYLNVANIHFADHPALQGFELPDTSHLNASSKKEFTQNLVLILKNIIK